MKGFQARTSNQSGAPMTSSAAPNPLFADWSAPFGVPPFGEITPAHFHPAFERALAAHDAEIAAIASASGEPSFDNTIAALERGGQLLNKVSSVFHCLAGAHTNDAL